MKRIPKRKLELQPLTIRKLERVRGGEGGVGQEDATLLSRDCPSYNTNCPDA